MDDLNVVMQALVGLIQGLQREQHVSLRYYKQVQSYFEKTKQSEDIVYILERLIAIGPVAQYQNLSNEQDRLFEEFLNAAQSYIAKARVPH